MATICPTVLAENSDEFDQQLERVNFAPRVQLDFMDGVFAPTKSIDLAKATWPQIIQADLHLMYKNPANYLETIIEKKPDLVIIHAEAEVAHLEFVQKLQSSGIKAGLCVLPKTGIEDIKNLLPSFDHLLIFGGKLGYFGGQADLSQAKKAEQAKTINSNIEIGWDGGVNSENARQLVESGIDVLNVGGFIQKAENPRNAFQTLVDLVK